jgi:hypothetical protein
VSRGRKPGFYVYVFYDEDGPVYVGKGSGRRFSQQQKRFFELRGEIVRQFHVESAAYNYECKLIAKLQPRGNRIAGGGGSIARRKANQPVPKWWRDWMKEIDALGTREWARRELAKLGIIVSTGIEQCHS